MLRFVKGSLRQLSGSLNSAQAQEEITSKNKYPYQNVFLTEKEYNQLKADFSGLDDLIEQLSAYIQSTGRKYADHAATLRIWAKRQQSEKKTAPGIPEYTFAEGESL